MPQFTHAEDRLRQFAMGERGKLHIGMECRPCYQWLLKIVAPYLDRWPEVDIDVRQKFQFGGVGALFGHEIDMLATPDPLFKPGLRFTPVFDYELVLVLDRMLAANVVETSTGHAIDAVSPIGMICKVPIYFDLSLRRFEDIYVPVGSFMNILEIPVQRLATLVSAQWVDVSRPTDAPIEMIEAPCHDYIFA